MSPSNVLLGLLTLLGQTVDAPPAPPEKVAVVQVESVEVRAGPSPSYYVTGKLAKNAVVRILKEENDWLGVEPPPGSFSLIHSRLVDASTDDRYQLVVVAPAGAPVRVGAADPAQKPDVVGPHLPRGAIVVVLGEARTLKTDIPEEGGKWWPIKPLNEVRWIPRDAVKLTPAVETVAAAPGDALKPNADPGSWAQAETAERAGDLPRAMQLYAATAAASPDRALQMRCYNRIQFLKDGNRGSAPAGYQPGVPTEAATGEFRPVANSNNPPPAPPGQSQAVGYGVRPAAQTTNPGRLRRAGFYVDGKQAYVLEDSQGHPQVYATPQPGVDLDGFVNKIVTLSGVIVYRGDLRFNYVTVTQVLALR
jgi:hypothetical protein